MRPILALAPLLLVSCASLLGTGEAARPATPPQDPATLVAAAVDDERARTDARDAALQAALDGLTQQVARLSDDVERVRGVAAENAAAALAAESAAASAQRMLILTTVVAAVSSLAALVLGVVVAWQSVLLRRAQREAREVATRQAQEAERAAMAATRPASAAAAAAGAGPAVAAPGARLRQRPLP